MTENSPGPGAKTLARATRVMIVDDHELIRDGLRQLICRQPGLEICGEAATERDAQTGIIELNPDLVIVDLSLQASSGLDLIKWIRQERPDTIAIVLTLHDERDYGERAIRAGAAGYVSKHLPARTILTAISHTLQGKLFFSEMLIDRLLRYTTTRTATSKASPVESLTDRELEILRLIGDGLTTSQTAKRLHLSPNTIGTYRERLKTKLGLASSAELTRFATLWVDENR